MASLDLKLTQVLNALAEAGVEIRTVTLGGRGGGLCQLGKRLILMIDCECDRATQYDRILHEIAHISSFDRTTLSDDVRADLQRLTPPTTRR